MAVLAWIGIPGRAEEVAGYGYSGREPTGSGLIYYRARHLDPALGRFTQRDPLGLAAGLADYSYVSANPVDRADPSGLEPDRRAVRIENVLRQAARVDLFDIENGLFASLFGAKAARFAFGMPEVVDEQGRRVSIGMAPPLPGWNPQAGHRFAAAVQPYVAADIAPGVATIAGHVGYDVGAGMARLPFNLTMVRLGVAVGESELMDMALSAGDILDWRGAELPATLRGSASWLRGSRVPSFSVDPPHGLVSVFGDSYTVDVRTELPVLAEKIMIHNPEVRCVILLGCTALMGTVPAEGLPPELLRLLRAGR